MFSCRSHTTCLFCGSTMNKFCIFTPNRKTFKCIDDCWHIFKDIFLSVLNAVAPIKEVSLKQRSDPWVDSNILDLIKKGIFT